MGMLAVLGVIGAAVLLILVVSLWRRSTSFPLGFRGPVPHSSGAMTAQLRGAAFKQSRDRTQRKELKSIRAAVGNSAYGQALASIDHLLVTQPDRDVKLFLLWIQSNIYQRTGRRPDEIRVLNELSDVNPHPLFSHNLAVAHSRLKHYEEAEACFREAIALAHGAYPLATYNLGIMYCDMGRKTDAQHQLSALQACPEPVPIELMSKLQNRVYILQ